ncbi:MAG: DUF2799 domain-containing protein, partial [Proteobacteria bacterium]
MHARVLLAATFCFMWMTACSSLPVSVPVLSKKPTQPSCANIDWFEVGRADGAMGSPAEKSADYHLRCDATPHPFSQELYANGRNAGIVEFCTNTAGFEAGRNGSAYEGVCPDFLEKGFLESFRIGQKVRELESDNTDLQDRIDGLVRLLA